MKYGKLPIRDSDEVIAISDIHGEAEKLKGMLKQVTPYLDNNPKCHLVILGDFSNRGPDTPGVYVILIDLIKKYPEQVFLIEGNHEEMLKIAFRGNLRAWWTYTKDTFYQMVQRWGLQKFDWEVLVKECVKRGIIDVLDYTIPYYESNEVICTHAPLDPSFCWQYGLGSPLDDLLDEPIEETDILDRMWYEIKWEFTGEDPRLSTIKGMDKYHICGHQFQHHKSPRIFRHRAFLDVGCGAKPNKPMIAMRYPGKQIFKQN